VDVWATESVLDLAKREGRPVMIVLNRAKQGTRVLEEVGVARRLRGPAGSDTMLGNRVAYAETLGQGLGVMERGRGAWTAEIEGLAAEVRAALAG
jgi:chromosome partitioning protein